MASKFLELRQAIPISHPNFYDELDKVWKQQAAYLRCLVAKRQQARAEKDYARADEIRALMEAEGVIVEDSKEKSNYMWLG